MSIVMILINDAKLFTMVKQFAPLEDYLQDEEKDSCFLSCLLTTTCN